MLMTKPKERSYTHYGVLEQCSYLFGVYFNMKQVEMSSFRVRFYTMCQDNRKHMKVLIIGQLESREAYTVP